MKFIQASLFLFLVASACSKPNRMNSVSDAKGISILSTKELVCEIGELKSGALTQLSKMTKPLTGTEALIEFDELKITKDLSAGAMLNGDQLSMFFDLKLPTGKVSSSTVTDKGFARLGFTVSEREFVLGCEVSQLGSGVSPVAPSIPTGEMGPTSSSNPVNPTGAVATPSPVNPTGVVATPSPTSSRGAASPKGPVGPTSARSVK